MPAALLRTLSGALIVAAMVTVAPTAAAHTALTASEPAADTT